MAVIQKIRNKAGVLVAVVIGFALVAFILGDFLTGGGGNSQRRKLEIAEVNGRGISYDAYLARIGELEEVNKFQRRASNLDAETQAQIRNQVYEDMVQDKIMDRELKELGLDVHGSELFDLIEGEKPHPFIVQVFGNPQTGELNRAGLHNFLQEIKDNPGTPDQMFYIYLEDAIYRERLRVKYNNLIAKGLYPTSLEAARRNAELNKTVDFSYVVKSYLDVSDSSVTVTDADIKKYYKEHIEGYKQEESRDIKYAVFEVLPSESDYKDAEDWIKDAQSEFETILGEDTEQYINLNSGERFNGQYIAEGDLDNELNEFAFSADAGAVFGPYFEDETYKLAKIAAIEFLPDSVKARHILLPLNENTFAQVTVLADSLKKMIEGGADFAKLALENSTDGSKSTGGELGWFSSGQMVKPFEDSCFFGNKNEVKIIYSQFGLHIAQIQEKSRAVKKVQIGYLTRPVTPSSQTDQLYYSQASEFAGINNTYELFSEAVKEGETKVQQANNIKPLDKSIAGLTDARSLVRWAYDAKQNEVSSKVLRIDNKYVVPALTKIREKGYIPLEDVKAEIELAVTKAKKADVIKSELTAKISDATGISDIESSLGLRAENATNIRFTSYGLPTGAEPLVIGLAVNSDEGSIAGPVAGANGVYVLSIDKVTESSSEPNYVMEKSILQRTYNSRANYKAMETLRNLAEVEDHRALYQ